MNCSKLTVRRRALIALAVAAVPLAVSHPVVATTRFFIGTVNNNWYNSNTDPTNWNTLANGTGSSGLPVAGDAINLTATNGVSRTVTYDYTGPAITVGQFTIDLTSSGTLGSATETLSMAANTLTVNGPETVGQNGNGTFNQTGGTNIVAGSALFIGGNANSVGNYTLGILGGTTSNGTLSVGANEAIGFGGNGNFTQNSGTHTLTGLTNALYLGYSASTTGSYALVGGNLTVNGTDSTGNSELIGDSGTGIFNQTGGTNTVGTTSTYSGSLVLGGASGSSGTYTLNSSTADLTVNGNETIGGNTFLPSTAVGVFNQINGTHLVTYNLYLGGGGTATYNLSGGNLTVGTINSGEFEATEAIGQGGAANFVQTGGTNTVGSPTNPAILDVGANFASTYALSGPTSVLTVYGPEFVAAGTNGTFTQTAGTHNVGTSSDHQSLAIGDSVNGGSYSLSGTGTLNVSGDVIDAGFASGTADSFGVNTPYGATFTQSGGTNSIAGTLYVAQLYDSLNKIPSTGLFALSGGSVSVGTNEIVGNQGVGIFSQSGGSNTVTGTLILGAAVTSAGSYTLSGTIAVTLIAGSEQLGGIGANVPGGATFTAGGTATFTQTGGINTVTGSDANNSSFYIFSGSSYTLSGGTLNLPTVAGAAVNKGLFALGAGATLNGNLKNVAALTATSGFSMAGGTVSASATLLNSGGAGQSGGIFSGTLANTGSYILSGGTFSGTAPTGLAQNLPSGTFTLQSGGTINLTTTFINQGTFNYTGGTFTGQLVNYGTATISGLGLALSTGVVNNGILNIGSTSGGTTATLGGSGLDNTATATFYGGSAITSTVLNDFGGTLITTGSTTITGSLTNLGVFEPASVTISGAVSNTGTTDIAVNTTVNAPTGFTNTGHVVMQGGRLIGGLFLNNPAGNLTFSPASSAATYGFSQELNNAGGVIVVGANNQVTFSSFDGTSAGGDIQIQNSATLTSNAFGNSGTIELQGATADFSGGQIINAGSITGQGRITNQILNDGILETSGGKLTLTALGSANPGGSQIIIDSGSTIQFTQGLSGSAGTITNNGGTFDNNNLPLTNFTAGIINGNGIFRTGGTGITNSGSITLTGGTSNLFGPLTNNSGGAVIVENGSTFFNNPVTNNGSFRIISGGSATFAGGFSGGSVSNTAVFINAGTLVVGGNFNNSGTASIGGTQNWATGTTFSNTAGDATFSTDAGSTTASPLSIVDTGGAVDFSSTQHLASLTVSSGASATALQSTPRNVLVTGALSVAGSLNLTNNDLIVHNGSLSILTTAIATAHGAGTTWWTGTTGITSSSAATSPSTTALGIELNSDGHGGTLITTFDNQTVTSTDVLVKYTFVGDADLSGSINATDYALIDNGFNLNSAGWRNGDFNYDGLINGDDYTLIDNAFNTQGSVSFATTSAGPTEMIATDTDQIASLTAVPEPATLALICIAAPLFSRRRRLT